MRSRPSIILIVASSLLTGFGNQKTELLIKRCVERGSTESTCRCVVTVQEEMLGPKFIDALYFQITGDTIGYEKKLYEIVGENPDISRDLEKAEARIKKRCQSPH